MALRKLFISYGNLLKRYPVPTQAAQTGFLMGSGDVIAQTFIEKKKISDINWKRTLPYASMGLVVGPAVGTWYRVLEHHFGPGGFGILVKKIACDQLLFAPCFLAALVSSVNALNGQSRDQITEYLAEHYVDIYITNCKIWPFVQMVNFYFVPLHYRVLLVQSVAVMWNTFLSYKLNSTMQLQETEMETIS